MRFNQVDSSLATGVVSFLVEHDNVHKTRVKRYLIILQDKFWYVAISQRKSVGFIRQLLPQALLSPLN